MITRAIAGDGREDTERATAAREKSDPRLLAEEDRFGEVQIEHEPTQIRVALELLLGAEGSRSDDHQLEAAERPLGGLERGCELGGRVQVAAHAGYGRRIPASVERIEGQTTHSH